MKIKVTKEHIEKGKKGSAFFCPIALVFKSKNRVTYNSMYIEKEFYPLPKKAQTFIQRFDAGKKVKPFQFTIKGLK